MISLDMPRLRFSTSTLQGEEIVPWLASAAHWRTVPIHRPTGTTVFNIRG